MSKIEWTDKTWNPTVGCKKVSPGCAHCYAEVMAKRLQAMGKPGYEGVVDGRGRWTGRINVLPDRLKEPLRWRKPTMVFVDSMSDLFAANVSDQAIADVFRTMYEVPRHTFQVLTKRPERMAAWTAKWYAKGHIPVNIWLGVSVENQETADERIPLLLRAIAGTRFISYEPALGPVDFKWAAAKRYGCEGIPSPDGFLKSSFGPIHINDLLSGIDWLICGGESGHGARPMHPDWARSARDQCQDSGVAFFFKQWGEYLPQEGEPGERVNSTWLLPNGETILCTHDRDGWWVFNVDRGHGEWQLVDAPACGAVQIKRVGKKAAGRLLDGREWSEYPESFTRER